MTRPRPIRRPRPPVTDFTTKLLFCKGCHNELSPGMSLCLVCGTPAAKPTAAPTPAGGPPPLPSGLEKKKK